jgi:hypothetical protein
MSGAATNEAAPPTGGTPPPAASAPPPLPGVAGAGGDPGGILDAVPPPAAGSADPANPGAKPPQPAARPEWMPEQFWNPEKGADTEALAKSWRDLRGQVSRGVEPPANADAYTLPKMEGVPETIGGKDDTLWSAIRVAAHKHGVTQAQLDAIAQPYLSAVKDAMARQPADTPEARKAAFAAELQRLGPNAAQVVTDTRSWADGLVTRGILTAEERAALNGIGTAEGVRALAKLRELTGERPIPVDALEVDGMSQADAQRLMTEGYRKNDTTMVERARKALARMDKAGQLRLP